MRMLVNPAALIVLAVTAGCSAAPPVQAVPVETPTTAAATAAASTATPSTKPRPVGRTQSSPTETTDVEVTVLRIRRPFKTTIPGILDRPGYEYAGVEAKVCVTRNDEEAESPVYVSWGPWSLAWESGVVVEAASSWSPDGWDVPLYPQDHLVRVGRCARGWIPFEVRKRDGKPALVMYTPGDGPALEWRVAG